MLRHSEAGRRPHEVGTLGRAFVLARWRSFARSIPLAVACVALLSPAPAFSASDPDPSKLWDAFPLDPNRERLGRDERASVPDAPKMTPVGPTAGVETADAPRTSFGLLALVAGAAVVILALAVHAAMRLRYFGKRLLHVRRGRPSVGHPPQPGLLWTAVPWGAEYSEPERGKSDQDMDVALNTHRSLAGQAGPKSVWQALTRMQGGSRPDVRRMTSIRHPGPTLRRLAVHVRDTTWNEASISVMIVVSALALLVALLISPHVD